MLNLQLKHEPERNRYVLVAPGHAASIQVLFPKEEVKKFHRGATMVPFRRPMQSIEYSVIKAPDVDYLLTDKGIDYCLAYSTYVFAKNE